MEQTEKEGITLVLSGGTARGLAHIGILEVLEENKVPIKRIIGVSAGALVGGFYCAGKFKKNGDDFLSHETTLNVDKNTCALKLVNTIWR